MWLYVCFLSFKSPYYPPSVLTFNHQIYPVVKAQSKTHPAYWLEGDVMTLWLSGSSWRENCSLTPLTLTLEQVAPLKLFYA